MVLNRLWCDTMKRVKRFVLIDTNMFVVPSKFKVDIFEEIKRLVPDAHLHTTKNVIKELKNLKDSQIGLKLIKRCNVKIIDKKGNTDDGLLRAAIENSGVICTNDKELKNRCLDFSIPIIFMRAKKKLEIIGE